MSFRARMSFTIFYLTLVLSLSTSAQEPAYPGVTSTEIRIGNITCVTGWAKAYASVSRAEAAYFQMVNARGGINGRKINFISLDDGCESNRSLALAQQLIEQENVLLLFSTLGTETNLTIRSYLNEKQVPQLFVESSSAVFDDPSHFPWTMGFFATYAAEGRAYANYILNSKPTAKIGVLSANDDVGREYVSGLRAGLGNKASSVIVKEVTYNAADGSLDTQLRTLKDSGADVFVNFSVGPFATQSIRHAFDLDWHPVQFIPKPHSLFLRSLNLQG